ncbi:MAG: ABC transporter permease subunit [Desulfovibrionaceae bacterium]|jgi:ABC-type nitrate/sulfonate/bicarbonate transport system permease component|nr:ABC transporter permease subunit [Desulfovibrionaceae bacterium]
MRLRSLLPHVVSIGLLLGAWTLASRALGQGLVPPPATVLPVLGSLLASPPAWAELGLTLARGGLALALALGAALVLGVPAGRSATAIRLLGPLVAALQSCPPVLWISLVMVWAGTGETVPLAVVFATVFPPLFANVAQGCMAIDPRLFALSRTYRVPRARVLARVVLPGVVPYLLAGLSYALSAAWKVAAVAEYLASGEGVGARLYWAYRMLDMPGLFAWALVLVTVGVGLEMGLVARLRRMAARFSPTTRRSA